MLKRRGGTQYDKGLDWGRTERIGTKTIKEVTQSGV